MRKSWTEDRLDHLNHRVEEGFARVDEQFGQLNTRLERFEDKVDRLTQGMVFAFASLFCTTLLAFVASQL